MSDQALAAIIGVVSAAATALVGAAAVLARDMLQDSRKRKQAAREQKFSSLYSPLYAQVSVPSWAEGFDSDAMAMVLSGALKIIKENLHLAPRELRDRTYEWEEMIGMRAGDALDTELRWLYRHVESNFSKLQKDLGITE